MHSRTVGESCIGKWMQAIHSAGRVAQQPGDQVFHRRLRELGGLALNGSSTCEEDLPMVVHPDLFDARILKKWLKHSKTREFVICLGDQSKFATRKSQHTCRLNGAIERGNKLIRLGRRCARQPRAHAFGYRNFGLWLTHGASITGFVILRRGYPQWAKLVRSRGSGEIGRRTRFRF